MYVAIHLLLNSTYFNLTEIIGVGCTACMCNVHIIVYLCSILFEWFVFKWHDIHGFNSTLHSNINMNVEHIKAHSK